MVHAGAPCKFVSDASERIEGSVEGTERVVPDGQRKWHLRK
jgi:hypothetical protein